MLLYYTADMTAQLVEIERLPDRLRHARASLGLTQAQTARRIGVGKLTVLRWESGDSRPRTVFTVARIAEFLDTAEQPDFLLKASDDAFHVIQMKRRSQSAEISAAEMKRLVDAAAARAAVAFRDAFVREFAVLVKDIAPPPDRQERRR
jgi:transcriptional regulator with XRE-family HTH domain